MNALRCRFDPPLEATFGPSPVQMVELSDDAAWIEHEISASPGKRCHLTFRAGGERFRVPSYVVRSSVDRERSIALGRLYYSSEIRFSGFSLETSLALRQLVEVLSYGLQPAYTEALQFEIVGL